MKKTPLFFIAILCALSSTIPQCLHANLDPAALQQSAQKNSEAAPQNLKDVVAPKVSTNSEITLASSPASQATAQAEDKEDDSENDEDDEESLNLLEQFSDFGKPELTTVASELNTVFVAKLQANQEYTEITNTIANLETLLRSVHDCNLGQNLGRDNPEFKELQEKYASTFKLWNQLKHERQEVEAKCKYYNDLYPTVLSNYRIFLCESTERAKTIDALSRDEKVEDNAYTQAVRKYHELSKKKTAENGLTLEQGKKIEDKPTVPEQTKMETELFFASQQAQEIYKKNILLSKTSQKAQPQSWISWVQTFFGKR